MSYPYHVLLLVPVELAEQAASAAAQISGNAADASPDFFSREVVDADGVVTHKIAAPQVTQYTLDRLPDLAQVFPGSAWVIHRRAGARQPEIEIDTWLEAMGLSLKE